MKTNEELCFQRDHHGNFIPKKVKVLDSNLKETDIEIFMIPLVRGELIRYFERFDENNDPWNDAEDWIILNKIISPKFTKDDLNRLKVAEQHKYINTVLINSGVTFKKENSKLLDDFAIKLQTIKKIKQEAKFIYFLHEHGYSLTSKDNNINNLTSPEIDMLIKEYKNSNKSKKGDKHK
jgi:hypothetical protein